MSINKKPSQIEAWVICLDVPFSGIFEACINAVHLDQNFTLYDIGVLKEHSWLHLTDKWLAKAVSKINRQ